MVCYQQPTTHLGALCLETIISAPNEAIHAANVSPVNPYSKHLTTASCFGKETEINPAGEE